MRASYADIDQARQAVWDMLVQSSTGRFPFPLVAEFPILPGRNRLPSAGLRTHCSIASNAVNPDAPHSLGSDEEKDHGVCPHTLVAWRLQML